MASYLVPFDSLICMLLGISFTVWVTLLLVFIIVPAIFGVSFGIRRLYMKALVKLFEWATLRMERRAREKNQELYKPYSNGIIAKEPVTLEQEIQELRSSSGVSISSGGGSGGPAASSAEFELADIFSFSRRGVESIVDDEVTKRFTAEELESWNLLTRSNYNFQHISTRLTVLWGLGVVIRYGFLLPLRVTLAFTGVGLLVVLTSVVGLLPNSRMKSYLSEKVHLMCYRICVRALTAIITYHDSENKPRNGGICVANHTSPIDVIILASDGCYAMVGQVHGGLIGIIQRAMVKACPHVWFERSEVKDRHLVAKRLSDHVADKTKLPILIFPEGTCINNTSVMMFKKGSFEINCVVYPVAIKYDPRFGDAFWNSSKFGMVNYLLHMMSSWAIVCSVWYLPPMRREEGEDAAQFANRVKAAIARKGGLVDLLWDGGLKRQKVKEAYREEQQKLYSKVLVGVQEERGCACHQGGAMEEQQCQCDHSEPEEDHQCLYEHDSSAEHHGHSTGTMEENGHYCDHVGIVEADGQDGDQGAAVEVDGHHGDQTDTVEVDGHHGDQTGNVEVDEHHGNQTGTVEVDGHHGDQTGTVEMDRHSYDHSGTMQNHRHLCDQTGSVDDDDGSGQSCDLTGSVQDGGHLRKRTGILKDPGCS
ncbi:glycerol-3-phosphate acyltransferase 4 [Alosa sapidissima]|uniref:glycerol-3-phosphate acyltransferase 4 n=1 Tax=Alosa sapidissima TaxID=34773 RepID=UPI001C09A5E6|nr:glycerol-3-phosphate acyltransferase 4 [Alosa sapidissima]